MALNHGWPGPQTMRVSVTARGTRDPGTPLDPQSHARATRDPAMNASPLLTDLYQLSMLAAYADEGLNDTAVFELFVRKLPDTRNFLMAAGLDDALGFLETLAFEPADLAWIDSSGLFPHGFARSLADFRFSGDVDAVPEGTVVFENEPILRVIAPLPEAQLVETRLVNILHCQTMIASKAARTVIASAGRRLIDFGLRRAHGAEAGLFTARASYIAGFAGSATSMAAPRYGIPVFGTMAHAYVQAHDEEAVAFERFAHALPASTVFLIDTYDTVTAARRVVKLAPRLAARGIPIRGVRLDSGDLLALSREVRAVLDAGGLGATTIFASGNLDEHAVAHLVAEQAPIDAFGIGTALATSSDAPALDMVYKLQEYAGRARRKRSPGKATWPGRKQVFRLRDAAGQLVRDMLTRADESPRGEPLLAPVMRAGRRIAAAPELATVRQHAAQELAALPAALRSLEPAPKRHPVEVSAALVALAAEIDRTTQGE